MDEQVVGMKLVTPNLGTLELSNENNPSLFRMAKVGTYGDALSFLEKQWLKNVRVDYHSPVIYT